MDMGIPEIQYHTAVESIPWKLEDGAFPEVKYIDHLPSYEEFFQNVLLKNQLCVIGPHATCDWMSRRLWVEADGSPNLTYLLENFGESIAPVADCNSEEFCAHPKTNMSVKDYITYWQSHRWQSLCENGEQALCDKTDCLYLKDWHFMRDFPAYHVYTLPDALCSDWLNEFWDIRKDEGNTDDYRFVYMGPRHSWTPFHADVLRSYSWSANICGSKKWIFYPPGEEEKLRDKHGQLAFDLRSPDLHDSKKFPDASTFADVAITIIQNPGEIIFVPSGWHHQVFNLEDTISINHNWMNGCSAHLSWEYIKHRLSAVQREIEDCRDMDGWHQQCQVILKADSGIDYTEFYNFLATIAANRIKVFKLYLVGKRGKDFVNLSHSFKNLELGDFVSSESDKYKHSWNNNNNVKDDGGEEEVGVARREGGSGRCLTFMVGEGGAEGGRITESHDVHSFDVESSARFAESGVIGTEIMKTCVCSVCKNYMKQSSQQPERMNSSRCVCEDCLSFSDKVSKDCILRNVPKHNQASVRIAYLCLYRGVVVNVAAERHAGKLLESSDIKDCVFREDSSCHGNNPSDDVIHEQCPHWAHCGPNMALFDLLRVLDIIQDMLDQAVFKIIMEDASNQSRFSVSPLDLITEITDIVTLAKDILNHEISENERQV